MSVHALAGHPAPPIAPSAGPTGNDTAVALSSRSTQKVLLYTSQCSSVILTTHLWILASNQWNWLPFLAFFPPSSHPAELQAWQSGSLSSNPLSPLGITCDQPMQRMRLAPCPLGYPAPDCFAFLLISSFLLESAWVILKHCLRS